MQEQIWNPLFFSRTNYRENSYNQRNDAKAMQLQLNYQLATGQFL